MKKDLATQYNNVAETYNSVFGEMNAKSVASFKESIIPLLGNVKSAIDLGCGQGDMIGYFQSLGITCAGVDTSLEMVTFARRAVNADIRVEDFAHTSFENGSFDLVTSKWAIQTASDIDPIYQETARILQPGGHCVFLVVHPFRHFLEKKKQGKNYFKQEIVDSIIFDGAITVHEPSHTVADYLSDEFLRRFSLMHIREADEFPAAEQIGGDIYPTYLIIVGQKK